MVYDVIIDVWSPMFNQCCETAFFSTKFEIKGWESKTKGWGSAIVVPPFRGNADTI